MIKLVSFKNTLFSGFLIERKNRYRNLVGKLNSKRTLQIKRIIEIHSRLIHITYYIELTIKIVNFSVKFINIY